MNAVMDLSAAFARFSAFERDAGLFSRELCGVRFWHLIRNQLYAADLLPQMVSMDNPHPDVALGRAARKRLPLSTRAADILFGNPRFALKGRDVLFSLTPRLAKGPGGERFRLMLDWFLPRLKSSFAVLERDLVAGVRTRHDGCGRKFRWTVVERKVTRYRATVAFKALKPEIDAAARVLAEEIGAALGVSLPASRIASKLGAAVAYDRAGSPELKAWLVRLRTRCVVEAVHYGMMNLLLSKAARELGIPSVELQHGTVYPAHSAYNLPVADSPYSPDYFLAWGDWWIGQTRNFPARRAVSTGYPFLEDALTQHPRKPRDGTPRVLFISQGTIGKRLSELAVELCRIMGPACRVTFKPHPNETKSWRTLYPALADSGVEVAEDATRGIYSWLAEADAVAGVYSTAMIEGLVWGAKAYVFRSLPGADTMAAFCSGGAAEYVVGADDLAARLRLQFASDAAGGAAFDRTDFFADNAAANVAAAIDRIVEGKKP